MPKLGLKCFMGSFLLSLVAVFAVTKAYYVWSWNEKSEVEDYNNVPVKNIELFAANEENDPIYDKFNDLNRSKEIPIADAIEAVQLEEAVSVLEEDVLYEPEDGKDNQFAEPVRENLKTAELQVMETDKIADEQIDIAASSSDENKEELQIADAATAPEFVIPLVRNYKNGSGMVSYSESADDNQIASASHDVVVDNYGADSVAAVTEPLVEEEALISKTGFSAGLSSQQGEEEPDPWEVAEISNRHAGKNSLNAYAAKHKAEIAAPDQKAEETPREEYKMQENILIPIPENIRNERNLTPQFSTSEENLKLERELRARHELPALSEEQKIGSGIVSESEEDDEQDFDDEETSKSLSDSIAEWFSGSKKKSSQDNISAPTKQNKKQEKSLKNSESSIFNKLLGIGKSDDENIVPSELKLSFQPNRAEISGQTLEWLHAFSDNSVKNEDVFIEIRIDKTAPYALQEKRLKLLYKILANNGVDYHKINIIFTDREPNSFIIRNVRYASEDDRIKAMKRADNPWF